MGGTALIVGATGASAKRLVEALLAKHDWSVVGLARHPPQRSAHPRLAYLRADLLDEIDCARASRDLGAVTHVYYTARAQHGESGIESVEENAAMFRHLLDALLPVARALEHVHLVQGGKYYGVHLGPYATPAREDDARGAVPNFYYAQEDLLRERQRGARWNFSISRPNVLCDFAPERARNLSSVLGAYAAICAELGTVLHFPGRADCWHALTEATDASHFAAALVHITTDPRCANRAFNVTNGDLFRWKRFWPRLAAAFGLAPGEVRTVALADWMLDKETVWRRIVERRGLARTRLADVAAWPFADFAFGLGWDVVSSTTELRQSGFHPVVDTEAMFLDHLQRYRDSRILP